MNIEKLEELIEQAKPSHSLGAYAGIYEHPGYGRVTVAAEGEELRFILGELDLDAKYRQFETWDLRYEALEADWPLTFVTNAEGHVAEAVIPLEPQAQPIRFRRSDQKEQL